MKCARSILSNDIIFWYDFHHKIRSVSRGRWEAHYILSYEGQVITYLLFLDQYQLSTLHTGRC